MGCAPGGGGEMNGTGVGDSRGSAPELPLAVLTECGRYRRGRFALPRWQVLAVVPGPPAAAPGVRCVHRTGEARQYLWQGLVLELHRDGAESYWYNLTGRRPSLFVACRLEPAPQAVEGDPQPPEEMLRPFQVSADHDEAGAHMEADGIVHAVPIPAPVHQCLERYVMEHCRPRAKRKRERT